MRKEKSGNVTEDMKSIRKRTDPIKWFVPLFLTVLLILPLPVFASPNISLPENVSAVDLQETGSIEIRLTDGEEGTSKEGVVFQYSKVADIEDGQYQLSDPYKESGVELNDIEYAEELEEAAEKLSFYEMSDGICKTNENGIARIRNLSAGVYLLYVSDQNNYEKIAPTLIAVPAWEEQEGTMLYDVTVYPKHTPLPKVPDTPQTASKQTVKTGDSDDGWIWFVGLAVATIMAGSIILIKGKK